MGKALLEKQNHAWASAILCSIHWWYKRWFWANISTSYVIDSVNHSLWKLYYPLRSHKLTWNFWYVGWSCVLNCFMLSSPVSTAFCRSAVPTSCYIFNVFFYSCSCHFSSRCMLELKFAIYYRAASLASQASYAVLVEESQAFLKHSPHTNSI